jgi:cardiolipin synthase
MQEQYLRDLANATEIVLRSRRERAAAHAARKPAGSNRKAGGSTSRAAAGALRIAHSMGSAFGSRRVLEQSDAQLLPWWIALLGGIALIAAIWPRVVAWPLAAVLAWIAIGLVARLLRVRRLRARKSAADAAATQPER